MNQTENRIYQRMVQAVRSYNVGGPNEWSGKPLDLPAVTLYPNILAEICAIPNRNIELFAEFANVSPEIMAAVVEDNEKLSFPELLRLAQCMGVPLGYLAVSELSIIDPATNKGKARRRALADLLKEADGLDFWKLGTESVLSALDRGDTITYASYRWAVKELSGAIARHQRAHHKPRSVRRKAA